MTLRQRLGLPTPPPPRDEPVTLAPLRPEVRRPEWLVRQEAKLRDRGRVADRLLTYEG